MNVYSRTLPLPGAARPVREHDAYASDRTFASWPPPRPVALESDVWGAPGGPAVAYATVAPWPAPDPVMRFDLPAPDLRRMVASPGLAVRETDVPEFRHLVSIPDLQTASMVALAPPSVGSATLAAWPAPTPHGVAPTADERTGTASRLVFGLLAAAGALAAGAAVLVSFF